MKIGSNLGPVGESSGPDRSPRTSESKGGVKSVKSTDTVELSPLVSQLTASGAEGEFDAKKVEAIKAAIRDGKFQINAEVVADKLIAHAADLAAGKPVQ